MLLAACAAAPPVKAQAVITPGAVALLANSTEPSAAQMLRRALVDANPDVRRLAARVVSVTHPEVAGALVAQLRVEQDIDTRAELVRGAMLLGGANALPVVLPEAEKAGPALLALAQWMARNQPAAFAARLDEWSEKVGTDYPDELRDAVVIAARQQPATQVELLPRWMQQAGAGAWFDTLVGVYPTAAATAERDTVLAAALSSARPSITLETAWFIVRLAAIRSKVPAALIDRAATSAATGDDWAAFGRQLLRRGNTPNAAATGFAGLIRREGKRHPDWIAAAVAAGRLSGAELAAVRQISPEHALSRADMYQGIERTPPPLMAGVFLDLLHASGCSDENDIIAVLVSFAGDGRPVRAEFDGRRLPHGCADAVMAIATLSTKDPRDAAVSPQVLFVPLSQSFAVCAAAAPSQPAVVLRDDSPAALSPRLTHEVKADYNEEGVHKRLEGHVEMEAIVSPGGCVSWARVVRSLGVLDIQAIDAVLQWEFDPGRVSGRPVPVRVNIDLAFTLK